MQTTIINDTGRDYIDSNRLLDFIEFLFEATKTDKELELNILFSDDMSIANLNKQFRHKDEPTNILSFYGYEGDILGDIIISVETMEKEANDKNEDIFSYMLFLIAHGFLHLTGYTHETMEKYDKMVELQNNLIEGWNNAVKS